MKLLIRYFMSYFGCILYILDTSVRAGNYCPELLEAKNWKTTHTSPEVQNEFISLISQRVSMEVATNINS